MRQTSIVLVISAILAGPAPAGVHPRAGTTSMAFLKIGAGARYAALADAGAAMADDAFACFWNPARLSEMYGAHSVCFQHNSWIAGTSVDEAYYALRLGRHRVGLSSRLLATDDIPMRDETPTEDPIAYYRAYDFFAGISYAFVPSRHLSAGITYRRLYEKIYLDAAYGHNLQAGINLNLIDPDVSVAATADNIGTRVNYGGAYYYKQPAVFNLGASWRLPWGFRQARASLAAVAAKPIDDGWQGRLGVEAVWKDMLALRMGYKAGHSTEGFAAGTGLAWRSYKIDYAFVPHKYELGTGHRFSLGLGF